MYTSTVPHKATGTAFFRFLPRSIPGFVDTIHVFFHGFFYLTTFPFFICTGVPGANSSSVHSFSYKSAKYYYVATPSKVR
jgi:hypothetical protein